MPDVSLVTGLQIRDTLEHNLITDEDEFSIAYWRGDGNPLTIRVENTHNTGVNIQVHGNMTKSYTGASPSGDSVTVGTGFAVAADDEEMRTLVPANDGWFPHIMLSVNCSGAPTSGYLVAYAVGEGVK